MLERHSSNYFPKHIVYISAVAKCFCIALLLLLCTTPSTAQFNEGVKIMKEGNKYGFANEDGRTMIAAIYDSVYDFVDGHAWVKSGKWGAIDRQGNVTIPTIYDSIRRFSSGDIIVYTAGKMGLKDKNGRDLYQNTYDDILVWYALFVVKQDGKWGLISRRGDIVQPIIYDGPPVMSLYELTMKKGQKTYTIDNKGELVN